VPIIIISCPFPCTVSIGTVDGTNSPMKRDLTQQTCVFAQLSTKKGMPSVSKDIDGKEVPLLLFDASTWSTEKHCFAERERRRLLRGRAEATSPSPIHFFQKRIA
jgi:hypothetical protein